MFKNIRSSLGSFCHSAIGCAVLAVTGAGASAHAAPSQYQCTLLFGGFSAWPSAINDAGDMAGAYYDDDGYKPVVWRADGSHTILPKSARSEAFTQGINNAGQLTGVEDFVDPARSRAVVWVDGARKALPGLPGNTWSDGVGRSINNHGVVAGSAEQANGVEHAAMWRDGEAIDLLSLGDPSTQADRWSDAYDINDAGVAVGLSDVATSTGDFSMRPVRWNGPGTAVDLGTLPGGRYGYAMAINETGLIVGISEGGRHGKFTELATAWDARGPHQLGVLPTHLSSSARSVNDSGVIVGTSSRAGGLSAAVVWYGVGPTPIDLNTLLDSAGCTDATGRHYKLKQAFVVNNSGVIAAQGDARLKTELFRLTPR